MRRSRGLDRGSLLDLLFQVVIPIGSSLAGVFMLGVLTRRTTWYGAAAGVVVSMPMVVWFALTKNSPLPHPILKAAAGVLICMLVGYLVSLAIPGPGRSLTNLTLHTMVKEEENGKQEATHE